MACQITVGVERCFRLLASSSGQLGYRVGLKEQRQPRATGVKLRRVAARFYHLSAATHDLSSHLLCFFPS